MALFRLVGVFFCMLGSALGGFPPPRMFAREPDPPPAVAMVSDIIDGEELEEGDEQLVSLDVGGDLGVTPYRLDNVVSIFRFRST